MKIKKEPLIWLAVAVAAFLLRSVDLDLKPIHFDESVNGWFVGQMWETGFYKYNPVNFHGPLYFYFLQIFETIFGFGIESLRLTSVLASMGILGLLYHLSRSVGRGALWAAAAVALSPAFVYYGRTAIHEMTFVFFQVLVAAGWFDWQCLGRRRGMAWTFAGLTGCLLLKETFILFVAVFGIAWLAAYVLSWRQSVIPFDKRYKAKSREWIFFVGAMFSVLWFFYSGLMNDPAGVANFFKAFAPWLQTGVAGQHEKPFLYYFHVMFKYEDVCFTALLCCPILFTSRVSLAGKFFGLLGAGTFLVYSLIPYKTPWLVLSCLWPLAIYFGELLEWLWCRHSRGKVFARVLAGLLTAFIAVSALKSVHLNWFAYDDEREAYVYVQTKRQFRRMQDYLQSLAQRDPSVRNRRVDVFSEEAWPLPYIFRPWTDVHWHLEKAKKPIRADFVFCEKRLAEQIRGRLSGEYWRHDLDVRAGREEMTFFVRDDEKLQPAESDGWRKVSL